MARFFSFVLPDLRRKGCRLLLAFSWLAGLLCGLASYIFAGDSLDSLMRGAVFGSVSISGLLSVTILPFLFSAFAVYVRKPRLLHIAAFGKAFALSFVCLGIMHACGSAGWLVRWLLCFSSCAFAPVLYLYWLRHISGSRRFSFGEAALVFSAAVLIGSVDFTIVAPFLARLIYS